MSIDIIDVSPYLLGPRAAFYYDFFTNKYRFASNVFGIASLKIKTKTTHYLDCDASYEVTDMFCDTCWVKRRRDEHGSLVNSLNCY